VHRVSAVGLYLKKTGITAGPYFFRYRFKGRRRAMDLGSIGDVSLAGARLRAPEFKLSAGVATIQSKRGVSKKQKISSKRCSGSALNLTRYPRLAHSAHRVQKGARGASGH
jgi:hypothetical protein